MKHIDKPYICIELNPRDLLKFQTRIRKKLIEFNIPAQEITDTPHLSIAYCLKSPDEAQLSDYMKEVAEMPVNIKLIGLQILEGLTTEFDWITVKIHFEQELKYAVELIEQSFPIKQFDGGFKAHISIFKVPKGILSKKDQFFLSRILELESMDITSKVTCRGLSIEAYDSERNLRLKQKLAS